MVACWCFFESTLDSFLNEDLTFNLDVLVVSFLIGTISSTTISLAFFTGGSIVFAFLTGGSISFVFFTGYSIVFAFFTGGSISLAFLTGGSIVFVFLTGGSISLAFFTGCSNVFTSLYEPLVYLFSIYTGGFLTY